MNFLKKLFGGDQQSADQGMYLYVRPKRCDEIVAVRIDPFNMPSEMDDGSGYYLRKVVSAIRCPFQAEVELFFDKGKRITDKRVTNGEFVSEEAYQAWQATKEALDHPETGA